MEAPHLLLKQHLLVFVVLILLMLIPVQPYPATNPHHYVPIIRSRSTTIRIFCFSDNTHDVSFQPDKKCEISCGYYDSRNSCCQLLEINQDDIVIEMECFRSSSRTAFKREKSIKFDVSVIYPQENVQVISEEDKSVLTCLEDTKQNKMSHFEHPEFYFKFAYLYDGEAYEFGTFNTVKEVPLPANKATVECNQTSYMFEQSISKANYTSMLESLDNLEGNAEQIRLLFLSNCLIVVIVALSIGLQSLQFGVILKFRRHICHSQDEGDDVRNRCHLFKHEQKDNNYKKCEQEQHTESKTKGTSDEVISTSTTGTTHSLISHPLFLESTTSICPNDYELLPTVQVTLPNAEEIEGVQRAADYEHGGNGGYIPMNQTTEETKKALNSSTYSITMKEMGTGKISGQGTGDTCTAPGCSEQERRSPEGGENIRRNSSDSRVIIGGKKDILLLLN